MAEVRWFSFHNVKHLTASRLDACGVPLRTIKALLRHQATTMTSRYLDSLRGVKAELDGVADGQKQGSVLKMKKSPSEMPGLFGSANQTANQSRNSYHNLPK